MKQTSNLAMSLLKIPSFFLFLTLTTGCTTTEKMKWVGVGGSKADGTIILGIEVPPKMWISETLIEWDTEQANQEASKKCKNWGYAKAEIFNETFPVHITCHPQGVSPCWSKTYRVTYQCIDK